MLTAIGKGIFCIKHICVTAFIFRDEDLMRNLLGIAPFADLGCKAVFSSQNFHLYHGKTLLLTGHRHSANLWHIFLNSPDTTTVFPPAPSAALKTQPHALQTTTPALLLHEDTRSDSKYVQFIHACLGSPPPTTFLHAVQNNYLAGPWQYPRLTAKLVRKHMPNSEATARGRLNKTPVAQPHASSQSVSARRRLYAKTNLRRKEIKSENHPKKTTSKFDPTTIPRSTTIHMDYTGRLPTRCSAGTLYFLVACWGSYIHFEPLTTLKGTETAVAIKSAVLFFRNKHVHLDTIRMDNQSSPEVRELAVELNLKWELVNLYQKEPNCAERAIRTGKKHIIAVRAGFHKECPNTFIDRCLFQIELTLNILHPFEYDPAVSAHHGVFLDRFDFVRHPIAPVGAKVLTWDSPETRGSWADHGVHGIYLGPAMNHFRGFHIWVPRTSAARVSGTIWWFLKPLLPDDDLLSPEQDDVLYPKTKERNSPLPNGADLLGRCFKEPTAGVCCITHLGPVDDLGKYTLHYRCLHTQAEYISTVEQITLWIHDGPLLPRPFREEAPIPTAPVTYPVYFRWNPSDSHTAHSGENPANPSHPHTLTIAPTILPPACEEPVQASVTLPEELRRSQRKRKAPDFLRPKFKGKVYVVLQPTRLPRKQRVPIEWVYGKKTKGVPAGNATPTSTSPPRSIPQRTALSKYVLALPGTSASSTKPK
jgi:hypothetical protein